MDHDENQGRAHDVRERIVSLMRANEQARKQPITGEEVQKLKHAASRLDRMLQSAADQEQQALKHAAARLDQLLADLRQGKDVGNTLKRRNRQPVSRQTRDDQSATE
jgi:cell division septum initiation protein DivIVA